MTVNLKSQDVIFYLIFPVTKGPWLLTILAYKNSFGIQLHKEKTNFFILLKLMYSYLPNPSARAEYDTKLFLKRSLTGLNSEFSFS